MKLLACVIALSTLAATALSAEKHSIVEVATADHPQVDTPTLPTGSLHKDEQDDNRAPSATMNSASPGQAGMQWDDCGKQFHQCVDECNPKDIYCVPKCHCNAIKSFGLACDTAGYGIHCPSGVGKEPALLKSNTGFNMTAGASINSHASGPNNTARRPRPAPRKSFAARGGGPPGGPGEKLEKCIGQYTVCKANCDSTYEPNCDDVCACRVIKDLGDYCRQAGYVCL